MPDCFVDAQALAPEAHLEMQAALQPYVDAAISKTINLPPGYGYEDFRALFHRAWEAGVKGCTVFPPRASTGAVLEAVPEPGLADCARCRGAAIASRAEPQGVERPPIFGKRS